VTKTVEVAAPAHYEQLFHERTETRKGEPEALTGVRNEALARFLELGFPHHRIEAWKKTDLRRLAQTRYEVATVPTQEVVEAARGGVESLSLPDVAARMVFIDGFHVPELSEVPAMVGLEIKSMAQVVRDREVPVGKVAPGKPEDKAATGDAPEWALGMMNLALFTDGLYLSAEKDVHLDKPVQVIHLTSGPSQPVLVVPRHFVSLGVHCEVTLVETYAGMDGSKAFTNVVIEGELQEGARLHRFKTQREPVSADHIGLSSFRLAKDAKLKDLSFSLGAGLSRHDVHAGLVGQGAEVDLNGVFLGRQEQHVDHTTTIVHAVPETMSRQLYKGIMDDAAHGVFTGKVVVAKGAQHTDADQQNKNLILSRKGLVDSTPQLEIYADDVKCAHGSAIGQIDPDQVFYLRTRGVPAERARLILTQAFAHEPLELVEDPRMREQLAGLVTDWFVAGNPEAVKDAPLDEEDPRDPQDRDPLLLPGGVPKR
jgi:Fe-S cluster assembly protein SufD